MSIIVNWAASVWLNLFVGLALLLVLIGLAYWLGYLGAVNAAAKSLRVKVTQKSYAEASNGDITMSCELQAMLKFPGLMSVVSSDAVEVCFSRRTDTTSEQTSPKTTSADPNPTTDSSKPSAKAVDETPPINTYPKREEVSWINDVDPELVHEVVQAYALVAPQWHDFSLSLRQKFIEDKQIWDDYYLKGRRVVDKQKKRILCALAPATTCEILREYAEDDLASVDEVPEEEREDQVEQIGILGMGISPFVLRVLLENHIYRAEELIYWVTSARELDFGTLDQDAVKWRLAQRLKALGFKSWRLDEMPRPITTAEKFAAEYFQIKKLTPKNREKKLWFIKDLESLDDRLEDLLATCTVIGCGGPYCGQVVYKGQWKRLRCDFKFRLMLAGEETPEARSIIKNEAGLEALHGQPCSVLLTQGLSDKTKHWLDELWDADELVECFRHSYYEGLGTYKIHSPALVQCIADNLVEQGWIPAPEEVQIDLDTHCTYLDMCTAARATLVRDRIQTVGQLVRCLTETRHPVYSWKNLHGMGANSRERILADLKQRGFIED